SGGNGRGLGRGARRRAGRSARSGRSDRAGRAVARRREAPPGRGRARLRSLRALARVVPAADRGAPRRGRGGPGGALVIRPMEERDIPAVVALHVRSFPDFFLTFLGPKFLALLYWDLVNGEGALGLVDEEAGRLRGVVAGAAKQAEFFAELLRQRRWAFARAAAGALLRRPPLPPRLLPALRRPAAAVRRPAEAREASAEACLMTLAVDPSAQGRGVGAALVEAFCRELAARGAPAVCLTTDRDDNASVNRFYERLGFRVARAFTTPEGRT